LPRKTSPDIAVFWASSANALFTLALWMNQDGQVGAKEFQKIAKLGADARSIIRGVGPVGLGAAGGLRMTPEQRCVVDAYHRFLEIYEREGF